MQPDYKLYGLMFTVIFAATITVAIVCAKYIQTLSIKTSNERKEITEELVRIEEMLQDITPD